MTTQLTNEAQESMTRLTAGLGTKSDKIRALDAAGYERADIARYLDIRYQHVRNVLVNDERRRGERKESQLSDEMRERMTATTTDKDTVSEKIRALSANGYSRSQIADFLEINATQVRNALRYAGAKDGGAEKDEGSDESFGPAWVSIGPGGRVVIPATLRRALNIEEGDELYAELEDGTIRLSTRMAAVHRARALVRQYIPNDVSLVEELLTERRREVSEERAHG